MAAGLSEGERDEVTFVGSPNGLEARLVPEAGVRFVGLPARGFDRSRPLSLVTSSLLLAVSTVRALWLLLRRRPDVVVGFGGYASIPVGVAAATLGVPLVLHEQNSVAGLANRQLSRWACAVATTYEASTAGLRHPERAVLTGNPVRPEIVSSTREEGRARLGLGPDELVLLVFGGSRGARHLNDATVALYPRLRTVPRLRVLHVAGRIEAASVVERLAALGGDTRYRVLDYLDDMGSAIAAADLVVARAGATSIAEITALGRPAVLVPYPYATDDHQTKNAAAVEQAGGALIVPDADLDGPAYADAVLRLLMDGEARDRMAAASVALGRPSARDDLVTLVRAAGERHRVGQDPDRRT